MAVCAYVEVTIAEVNPLERNSVFGNKLLEKQEMYEGRKVRVKTLYT